MFYPRKSIHEILAAATEVSTATEIVYRLEDEWKKSLWAILGVALGLVVLLATIAGGLSYALISAEKERQEASLLTSVKAISKLATVEHHYTNVIQWDEKKDLLLFKLKKSILATGSASIMAGIDLQKGAVSLDKEGSEIHISFPHAEIFSVDSKLSFAGEDDTFFQRISLDDRNRLIEQSKEKFRQQALDSGILAQAEEKAASQVQEYLQKLGYQVKVTFP